ncbi:MAG: hypothetical protein Q8P29_00045 [Candidatus Levybacteria bacterium]|nr:hypothetical protein [Candidatus Levybacteria bacterium]MDZ4227873.1 hypothetical protein [Candidatus Levybacteria bacterium]
MDDNSILGGVLNQLGQTVKQATKQVVKIPEEMATDAGRQVGGSAKQNANESRVSDDKQRWQSDEERITFLKGLYGPKQSANQTSANPLVTSGQGEKLSEFQEQIKDKSPEEQKALMELRNQLHKENYYDPTFNSAKKQEERPAEKVENEKKQEMQDLQQKEEEKPQPLAVVREQNKAEMFRGAAG